MRAGGLGAAALIVAGALLIAGTRADAAEKPKPTYVEEFYCEKGPLPLRTGRKVSVERLRQLGSVLDERIEKEKTDHAETRILRFDGLAVHARFAAGNLQSGLVETVTISEAHWRIADGLRVGDTLSALRRKFDRPLMPVDSIIRVCGDGDCVAFHIEKERISRIEYACYSG